MTVQELIDLLSALPEKEKERQVQIPAHDYELDGTIMFETALRVDHDLGGVFIHAYDNPEKK